MPEPRRIPIDREAAEKAGFWTKKHLGQHLLRDPTVVSLGLEALRPEDCGAILEIGPGLGALTESLLKAGVPVIGWKWIPGPARPCGTASEAWPILS